MIRGLNAVRTALRKRSTETGSSTSLSARHMLHQPTCSNRDHRSELAHAFCHHLLSSNRGRAAALNVRCWTWMFENRTSSTLCTASRASHQVGATSSTLIRYHTYPSAKARSPSPETSRCRKTSRLWRLRTMPGPCSSQVQAGVCRRCGGRFASPTHCSTATRFQLRAKDRYSSTSLRFGSSLRRPMFLRVARFWTIAPQTSWPWPRLAMPILHRAWLPQVSPKVGLFRPCSALATSAFGDFDRSIRRSSCLDLVGLWLPPPPAASAEQPESCSASTAFGIGCFCLAPPRPSNPKAALPRLRLASAGLRLGETRTCRPKSPSALAVACFGSPLVRPVSDGRPEDRLTSPRLAFGTSSQ